MGVRTWVLAVVAGCGGGGDTGPDGGPADAAIDADEGTGFRVEVAITGVRDPMSVELHAGGIPDQHLPITQDGTFHFPVRVADGTTVSVSAASAQQCDPPTANATVVGATATVELTCDGLVDLRAFASTVPLRVQPAFDPRVTSYRLIQPLLLDPADPGDRMTVTPSAMYASATVGTQPSGPIPAPPIAPATSALTITLASPGLVNRDYSFAMSRDLAREAYVKASDTVASSSFGGFRASIGTPANGVAVSGDLLAVGAPRLAGDSGAVYVYTRAGTAWKFQQKLPAVVGASAFGAAVALDRKTLAIGAPSDGTGAVYIYHLAGATWTQDQVLRPPVQAVTPKSFGGSLALANDALVIGAPDETPSGSLAAGAAYVYRDPGTSVWSFEARLATAATDGRFGTGVAIAGDAARIAVGAPGDNAGQGAAYVFTAPAWTVSPRISGNGTNSFGGSLGIDADVLVVGAFGESPTAGRAHVFARNGTSWPPSPSTPTLAGQASAELFGFSVAVRRGRAIIGAPSDDEGGAFNCGAAYFFRCTTAGACTLERRAVQSHPGNGDRFGHSVALDNVTFAVGSPAEQSNATNVDGDEINDSLLNAGAVYVFR